MVILSPGYNRIPRWPAKCLISKINNFENRDALGLMHHHDRAGLAIAPRQFPVAFLHWLNRLASSSRAPTRRPPPSYCLDFSLKSRELIVIS